MHVHNEPTIRASEKDIESLTGDDGRINPARVNALLTEAYRMGAAAWIDVKAEELTEPNGIPVSDIEEAREILNGPEETEEEPIKTKAEILRDGLDASDPVENFVYQCEPDKPQLQEIFHAAIPHIIELAQTGAYTGVPGVEYMKSYHQLQEDGGPDNDNPIERLLWHCTPPDGEGRFRELLRQMIEGV